MRNKETLVPKYWTRLPIIKREFKSDHKAVINLPLGVFLSHDSTKPKVTLEKLCVLQGSPKYVIMFT